MSTAAADKTTKTTKAVPEKEPLPDIDEVLAARDEREAAGASTRGDDETSKKKGPSRLARARARLADSAGKDRGTSGFSVRRLMARFAVAIACYLIVFVTAMTIIPSLGAWLHQESGASLPGVNTAGLVALWLAPFGFLCLMLAVAEIALIRWMWSKASQVGRTRLGGTEEIGMADPASAKATKTPSPTMNRGAGRKKRSK